MERAQHDLIIKDLSQKMVILTGPRQVGKTSLALEICKGFERPVYLNYDSLKIVKSFTRRVGFLIPNCLFSMNYTK